MVKLVALVLHPLDDPTGDELAQSILVHPVAHVHLQQLGPANPVEPDPLRIDFDVVEAEPGADVEGRPLGQTPGDRPGQLL